RRRVVDDREPGRDGRAARDPRPRAGGGALLSGRCRPQLGATSPDCAEPLAETRPCPRLDFRVARRGLAAGRLQVLEPGVGLLDQQELVRMSILRHRGHLPVARMAPMVGPGSDGIPSPAGPVATLDPRLMPHVFSHSSAPGAPTKEAAPSRAPNQETFIAIFPVPTEAKDWRGAGAVRGRRSSPTARTTL